MTLYLSRLVIARNPQISALAQLLNPDDSNRRMDAHHRLLWSAFSFEQSAKRDFLWRHDGRDGFVVLSERPPQDSPLFEPPQVREFAPALNSDDRLDFVLRANATRTQATGRISAQGKPHKAHLDLVMDALHPIRHDRAQRRMELAQEVAQRWLARQGEQHGFRLERVTASDYSVIMAASDTRRGKGQPRFGVLDLSGTLTVLDPAIFLQRMASGFGRARAFGCGLMLIRRT